MRAKNKYIQGIRPPVRHLRRHLHAAQADRGRRGQGRLRPRQERGRGGQGETGDR